MKQRNGSRLTDSQSKEKLSNGVPSYSHSPGTSPPIKDIRQSRHIESEAWSTVVQLKRKQ